MCAVLMEEKPRLDREYSIEEVADALGVSQDTVRNRIKTGKLKARREGKLYRIRKTDFEAYVASTWNTPEEEK